jgi:hypothetical protein
MLDITAWFDDLHNKQTIVVLSFQTIQECHVSGQNTLEMTWGDVQARPSGDLTAMVWNDWRKYTY